eukprot:211859_1
MPKIYYVNNDVLNIDFDKQHNEYYIIPKNIYLVNMHMIWICMPLAVFIASYYPYRNPSIVTIGTMAINACVHIISTVVTNKYNPGLFTAVTLFIPYCVCVVDKMIKTGLIVQVDIIIGLVIGVINHLSLFVWHALVDHHNVSDIVRVGSFIFVQTVPIFLLYVFSRKFSKPAKRI